MSRRLRARTRRPFGPGGGIAAATSGDPLALFSVEPVGNSIMQGFDSAGTVGVRESLSYLIRNNGYNIPVVGPFSTGAIPDPRHCCESGAGSASIRTNFLDSLSGKTASLSPRLVLLDMGINPVANNAVPGDDAAAETFTYIQQMQVAGMAKNPAFRIAYTTLMPLPPGDLYEAEVPVFNAAWQDPGGYLDQFNALYPSNQMILIDWYAAMAPYSATRMDDRVHPTTVGFDDHLAPVTMAALGPVLREFAPSINALSVAITFPAAGYVATVGVPVEVTGTVTRSPYNCEVEVKDTGGAVLGDGTFDDFNVATFTYEWTPQAGDVGSFTLNATITDTHSSQTANAAGVNITVDTAADYADITSIYSNVAHDWWAETGVTVATGVSQWTANVSGRNLAQATGAAQPALTDPDATLNSKKSIHGDGTDDALADATLNFAAPATQPLCFVGIGKQRTWTSGDHLFASSSTALRLTQIAGTTPQLFAANGSLSPANAAATLGTWFRCRVYFSGSASDYFLVGSTNVTGNFGNNDPAAGFWVFSRNGAGSADCDWARLTILNGDASPAEHTLYDGAAATFYNNIPAM